MRSCRVIPAPPDDREPPQLVFDKKFGRQARDVKLWRSLVRHIRDEAFLQRSISAIIANDTGWNTGEPEPEYWLCSVTRMLYGWT